MLKDELESARLCKLIDVLCEFGAEGVANGEMPMHVSDISPLACEVSGTSWHAVTLPFTLHSLLFSVTFTLLFQWTIHAIITFSGGYLINIQGSQISEQLLKLDDLGLRRHTP